MKRVCVALVLAVLFVASASAQPAWTHRAFDASQWTASGGMTWTVEEADVLFDGYGRRGKTVTYNLVASPTDVGGTASNLLFRSLPAGIVPTGPQSGGCNAADSQSRTAGRLYVSPTSGDMIIVLDDARNWTIGGNVTVNCSITFETE